MRYIILLTSCLLLSGCASSGYGNQSLPNARVSRNAARPFGALDTLFKFNDTDGSGPTGLVDLNGTFYGTSSMGATLSGTVFSLTPQGKFTSLYTFGQPPDAISPQAPLIAMNGKLYGTSEAGGTAGEGTVFSLTPSGTEKVIYSFQGGSDGSSPTAPLLAIGGKLYGTAGGGGIGPSGGYGTVFVVTTSGSEKVLYRFRGYSVGDGSGPISGLMNFKGKLYGVTITGGKRGGGTVYSVTRAGNEKVLHEFGGTGDGYYPSTALTAVGNTLYGMTQEGDTEAAVGTVYQITPTGHEQVIHVFQCCKGGANPIGGALTNVYGLLYGVTPLGGQSGKGTIFSMTTSGTETVLHSFSGPDGTFPGGSLLYLSNSLYGVTAGNIRQQSKTEFGTIYSLTP
ncbi:MAG: choice-of-anchor tandem repeat GloVer-containing protein [Candidatus Tumulicola sp.]